MDTPEDSRDYACICDMDSHVIWRRKYERLEHVRATLGMSKDCELMGNVSGTVDTRKAIML